MNTNQPVPFWIEVPPDKLDRILERVRTYQWFPVPAGAATNWVDPDFLFRLTQYSSSTSSRSTQSTLTATQCISCMNVVPGKMRSCYR